MGLSSLFPALLRATLTTRHLTQRYALPRPGCVRYAGSGYVYDLTYSLLAPAALTLYGCLYGFSLPFGY